ncbi:hypothetical protein ABZ446_11380 [Streptomyces sp. NPDC005813]|uniref:hypothetical protein n=1 Tax=Streptomyces sp. NPDC005813 TaxID=3155592 RepID=UPI0033F66C6B
MNRDAWSRVGSLCRRVPVAGGLVLFLGLAMTGSVPATSAAQGPKPPGWARLCDSSLSGPAAEALVRLTGRRQIREYPGMRHASLAKVAESVRGREADDIGFCTLYTQPPLAPAELQMAADVDVVMASYPLTKRSRDEGYLYFGRGGTTETFTVSGAHGAIGRHAWLDFHCRGMGREWVRMALTVHWSFRGNARRQAVDMVTVVHSMALKLSEELGCGPEDELPAVPPTEPIEESAL